MSIGGTTKGTRMQSGRQEDGQKDTEERDTCASFPFLLLRLCGQSNINRELWIGAFWFALKRQVWQFHGMGQARTCPLTRGVPVGEMTSRRRGVWAGLRQLGRMNAFEAPYLSIAHGCLALALVIVYIRSVLVGHVYTHTTARLA